MKSVLPVIFALAAVPAFAEVTAKKKENCAATAGVVASAIEMRAGGAGAVKVKQGLTKGDNAVDAKYIEAVGPIVDWVFTLDDATMAADVPTAYEQQCLSYED